MWETILPELLVISIVSYTIQASGKSLTTSRIEKLRAINIPSVKLKVAFSIKSVDKKM